MAETEHLLHLVQKSGLCQRAATAKELFAVLVTRYSVNSVVVSSIKSQEWSRTEEDG